MRRGRGFSPREGEGGDEECKSEGREWEVAICAISDEILLICRKKELSGPTVGSTRFKLDRRSDRSKLVTGFKNIDACNFL